MRITHIVHHIMVWATHVHRGTGLGALTSVKDSFERKCRVPLNNSYSLVHETQLN